MKSHRREAAAAAKQPVTSQPSTPTQETSAVPANYGYGMTVDYNIPIPDNVLTRDSPVVQQNIHLIDKLGRVPVMPVKLPAPLPKPVPSQVQIYPAPTIFSQ